MGPLPTFFHSSSLGGVGIRYNSDPNGPPRGPANGGTFHRRSNEMRVWLLALMLGVTVIFGSSSAMAQSDGGGLMAAEGVQDASAEDPGSQNAFSADAGTTMSGEQFQVRLRDLEQRINELKEEIFRSKARLSLLAESILNNVIGGARAVIQHENQMGALFRLVRAVYALDGAPILTRTDDNGSLADQREFSVYNGQIAAGDHSLSVSLEYQGNGYGVFNYVKGYTFRQRNTQSFTISEGKAIQIRVVGYEQGGPTTPPDERPAIRYITRILSLRDLQDTDTQPAAGAAATPAAPAAAQGGGR